MTIHKSIISMFVAFGVLFGITTTAFAAMPNETVEGYKQAEECGFGDIRIWEAVGSKRVLTGCVDQHSYSKSLADARHLQDNGVHFGVGETINYRDGSTEVVERWFNMGLVALREWLAL